MTALRMGILGAAGIAPWALIKPAKIVTGVSVAAVAARDRKRADAFARRHKIAKVHASYEELIADPQIDAIYNPLPNSLHCKWTIAALEAGKHVLCEKPLASNAEEAERMGEAARHSGCVLMEAFHYRYHPLAQRMQQIVGSGKLGNIERVETWMCIPLPNRSDIRYDYALGGGATMDTGCYAIHMLRLLAGGEPVVQSAQARLAKPDVDRWMSAELKLPSGGSGKFTCSLWSSTLLKISARVVGDKGEMRVFNPVMPQLYHRLTVRTAQGRDSETVPGEATYTHQLRAFLSAVTQAGPVLTPPSDSLANMRVIDAVYAKAGLRKRGEPLPA